MMTGTPRRAELVGDLVAAVDVAVMAEMPTRSAFRSKSIVSMFSSVSTTS